jgi:hypothetical protein
MYVICHLLKGTSHSGKKIAYLNTPLYSVANHEVGHLLGLGHAGSYNNDKLNNYGDSTSAMSMYPSPCFTAPQYYHLGWLPKKEVALFENGKVYIIKKINAFKTSGLSAVMIPKKVLNGQRDAFVSYPWVKKGGTNLALHLAKNGSSQMVKLFGNEYHDKRFTGLKITKLGMVNDKIKMRITLEPV